MGLVSCLGDDLDQVSSSLQEGRSGVVFSPERKERGFRSGLMTRLPEIDYRKELDRRARKFMPEPAIYCAAAANRAIESANLQRDQYACDDTGIIIGNDSSSGPLPELMETIAEYGESHFLGSTMVIRVMNSTVSMNLGPYLGARGINLTLSAACSSGAHSLGLAYQLIGSGAQRMIFAGGAQEMNWLSMISFDAMKSFSIREDEPQRASRPFDAGRDGLIPGGGGAILILESLESAEARSARIFGEIIGYGYSSDGDHLTLPSGEGARRCMERVLATSGVKAGEIDYINAHGTSTPMGDRMEASAIHELFGSQGPPVSSTKSLTGHECWMAGASEAIYCLLMMRDGFLAPNMNFEGFDEETPEINLVTATERGEPKIILSNSFGFGGTNAALIFKRFEQ
jgi:3-oxoacyl-[acyl-carrier-protein] synthase I